MKREKVATSEMFPGRTPSSMNILLKLGVITQSTEMISENVSDNITLPLCGYKRFRMFFRIELSEVIIDSSPQLSGENTPAKYAPSLRMIGRVYLYPFFILSSCSFRSAYILSTSSCVHSRGTHTSFSFLS